MEGGSRASSQSPLQAHHISEMLTHSVRPGRPLEGLLAHPCFPFTYREIQILQRKGGLLKVTKHGGRIIRRQKIKRRQKGRRGRAK